MKKLMVCIAVSMLYSMCAYAQQMSVDINKVEAVPTSDGGQNFFLVTQQEKVRTNYIVGKIVEAQPSDFCLVEIAGEKYVFKKTEASNPRLQYVFEVNGVPEMKGENVEVTMTNGYKFTDPDIAWLAVRPGQHVKLSQFVGLEYEILVYETVPRETALSNVDISVLNAPAKSEASTLLKEAKAKFKKNKDKAQLTAMSSATPVEKKVSGPVTLNFSHR